MNPSEPDDCRQPALARAKDVPDLEPNSSSSNHSFPHINEGIGSLRASEKCNKKSFCECSHLWNFKRTSCKQNRREQILSHSSKTPLLPRITLSSLFSSVFLLLRLQLWIFDSAFLLSAPLSVISPI